MVQVRGFPWRKMGARTPGMVRSVLHRGFRHVFWRASWRLVIGASDLKKRDPEVFRPYFLERPPHPPGGVSVKQRRESSIFVLTIIQYVYLLLYGTGAR